MNRLNIALTRRGLLAAGAAGTAAAAGISSSASAQTNSIDCPKGFRCCS